MIDSPEAIKILIDAGLDIDTTDLDGYKTLMKTQSLKLAQLLIEAGVDVNCTTTDQNSYLIAVLKENKTKLEIVEIIINAGADVNFQEPMFGTTALMHVRNLNMAKILIQAGADPSIRDFNGHLAYQQYHFYLYEELENLRKYLNACYENHLLNQ
ncbi:MAG: hypothetical protein B7Y48_03970, partial [Methylophilales bacterium 28-44-11]